jgi:hypothetical protein
MNVRHARRERLELSSFNRLGFTRLLGLLGLLKVKLKNGAQIFVKIIMGAGNRLGIARASEQRTEFVEISPGQNRLDE